MPQKKALLMGINYINNPPRFLLQGCYTDLEWAEETLNSSFGFSKENIRVYRDDDNPRSFAKPDRNNFLAAVKWLVEGAQPGDLLYWHFSGHGIQVPIGERPGYEWETDLSKELGHEALANGQQEALAPCDIEWVGGKWVNFVSTYELRKILKANIPPGCLLLCCFDCCHSGTTLRSVDMEYCKPRCLPRNLDKPTPEEETVNKRSLDDDLETERSFPDYCILIAGAHSKQTAADAMIDGKKCGALSCYFYKTIRENPRITYIQLIKQLKVQLKEKRFTQVPQLDALEDRDEWVFMDVTHLVKEAGSAPPPAPKNQINAKFNNPVVKKPIEIKKKNQFMDEEDNESLDSVLDAELSKYSVGGLSDEIVTSLYTRGLAAPDQVPAIPLGQLLDSSKLKSQLQHFTAHGVSSLADIGKLSQKDWDFIKVEVGLRNRLVNVCTFVNTLSSKTSDDTLLRILKDYIITSNVGILAIK